MYDSMSATICTALSESVPACCTYALVRQSCYVMHGLCEGRLAVFVSVCDDDVESLHLVCMNSCLHGLLSAGT